MWPFSKPKRIKVDRMELRERLLQELSVCLRSPDFYLLCLDNDYCLPVIKDCGWAQRNLHKRKYKREVHDCDDFAVAYWFRIRERAWKLKLKATFAAGIVGGTFGGSRQMHMKNWLLLDTGLFWWEPQTEKMNRPSKLDTIHLIMG